MLQRLRFNGKVSLFDILKALEPEYRQFEHPQNAGGIGLSRFAINDEYLKSFVDDFSPWDELVKKDSCILHMQMNVLT